MKNLFKDFTITAVLIVVMIIGIIGANHLENARLIPQDLAFVLKDSALFLHKFSLMLLCVFASIRFLIIPQILGEGAIASFKENYQSTNPQTQNRAIWIVITFLFVLIAAAILM